MTQETLARASLVVAPLTESLEESGGGMAPGLFFRSRVVLNLFGQALFGYYTVSERRQNQFPAAPQLFSSYSLTVLLPLCHTSEAPFSLFLVALYHL